jgi:DNA-binding MarR family transcriptional regulator
MGKIQNLNIEGVVVDESTAGQRELSLLEQIERDPDTTQATMATRLGVAVGTVNWHLKRLVSKGYVKVKRAERRKLRYIITPEGLALRARLTVKYVENSMELYRQTRRDAQELLGRAKRQGFTSVRIDGVGDIADVCRLTCLEQGLALSDDGVRDGVAVLRIEGRDLKLVEPSAGLRARADGLVPPAGRPVSDHGRDSDG